MFAEQTGQDMSYEAIEAPLDGFADTIRRLRDEGYQGCNVTVPFKFEAYALCTRLGERAREAKAVNTLIFRDGEILGANTDGAGLDKAMALAQEFEEAGTVRARSYADLAGRQYDLVINATSSGLKDELPPLPDGLFKPGALAYDMMYGRETPFMAYARRQGASVVADGLGMLVEQAAEAFYLWRNVRPDTKPVLEKLRK